MSIAQIISLCSMYPMQGYIYYTISFIKLETFNHLENVIKDVFYLIFVILSTIKQEDLSQ